MIKILLDIEENRPDTEQIVEIEIEGKTVDIMAEIDLILIQTLSELMIKTERYDLFDYFKSSKHMYLLHHEIGKALIDKSIKD